MNRVMRVWLFGILCLVFLTSQNGYGDVSCDGMYPSNAKCEKGAVPPFMVESAACTAPVFTPYWPTPSCKHSIAFNFADFECSECVAWDENGFGTATTKCATNPSLGPVECTVIRTCMLDTPANAAPVCSLALISISTDFVKDNIIPCTPRPLYKKPVQLEPVNPEQTNN
jgi:hypothetical protein